MTRSLFKGPFVDGTLLSSKKKFIWSRQSSILPQFVNKTFMVHNGKSFVEITIQESMIGHKFGEFALTRKKLIHKKKDKKK
jgi:small subunit ribosomal protein S19|uniref:Small ribosomal subunit protein uS19m n=1 Tax=Ostreococcus tauri TaxID=70448 RepID=S5M5E6_OSTTA|nr:ribosomal protein S19 [Ostreococcus tauri]AGR43036.1 ribosomal protein S19 [Ostreococcus tauri]AGR43122.1 ribosomal protein S19 [Ostreococcus tauri]AGR43208.1 ribosomal protein S19 [Ostreococcus tauri]